MTDQKRNEISKEIIIQKLAFIKYLFNLGLSQSYQAERLSSISVLVFHDAVELFLQLCLKNFNVIKTENMGFMTLVKEVDTKLKEDNKSLTQKEGMKRLNDARKSLKHHANFPSKSNIEDFRVITQSFLRENTKTVFDIEWDDVSLVDLVSFARTKDALKDALTKFKNGLIGESITDLAVSFEQLIYDYEMAVKGASPYYSPFFFGNELRAITTSIRFTDKAEEKLRDTVNEIIKSAERTKKAIKLLSLGIDFRKYSKFKFIVSSIDPWFNEQKKLMSVHGTGEYKLTKEDLDFCVNFIVESSLKLQEFSFELRD